MAIFAWLVVASKEGLVPVKVNWPIFSDEHFERLAIIGAVLITLFAIFWIPFRRHKSEVEKFENEKSGLLEQHLSECERLQAGHQREVSAFMTRFAQQEELIRTLQSALDDRAARKQIRDTLGQKLLALRECSDNILSIDPFSYAENIQRQHGEQSAILLKEIATFLEANLGSADMALFTSLADITWTPINLAEDKPSQWAYARARILDRLAHHEKNLFKIIEGYKP
ncbi:MAG TPA: hypothetical protein VFB72_15285 [Verrucomicrobiae bacterium]|nr:hypothetical protein [Verrucomicrobiae bacterium]